MQPSAASILRSDVVYEQQGLLLSFNTRVTGYLALVRHRQQLLPLHSWDIRPSAGQCAQLLPPLPCMVALAAGCMLAACRLGFLLRARREPSIASRALSSDAAQEEPLAARCLLGCRAPSLRCRACPAGEGGNRAVVTLRSSALDVPLLIEVGAGTATVLQPSDLALAALAGRPLPVLELLRQLQQVAGLALAPLGTDLAAAGLLPKDGGMERDMCADLALARWGISGRRSRRICCERSVAMATP
jgi:hypothetical protein